MSNNQGLPVDSSKARGRRVLLIVLGVFVALLALMGTYAFLFVPSPLTSDERLILGTWKPEAAAEFTSVLTFRSDRTASVIREAKDQDEYRWKFDGPYLLVQRDGQRDWERLGPIRLEANQLVLQHNGPTYMRQQGNAND